MTDGGYRAIRFRCDTLSEPDGKEVSGGLPPAQSGGMSPAKRPCVVYEDGVLAILHTGAKPDEQISVLDADYSERMADSVIGAFTRLFTIDGMVARAELAQVLAKVHTFLGDGASSLQKAGVLLRAGPLPSLNLLLRDPVHALRTSTTEPLKISANFQEFWEDIFNKRHALVPDIQNSVAWQRRLVLAQQHVIEVTGKQGGGITCALRHLSFAKQRFDSATGPARKCCCMLSAIVILLVVVAGDSRLASDQRGRAQALLDHMTPRRITTAGLFADYTAECSRLFRRFEKRITT